MKYKVIYEYERTELVEEEKIIDVEDVENFDIDKYYYDLEEELEKKEPRLHNGSLRLSMYKE